MVTKSADFCLVNFIYQYQYIHEYVHVHYKMLLGTSCQRMNLLSPVTGAICSMWVKLGWLYYLDQDRGMLEAVYLYTGQVRHITSDFVRPAGLFLHVVSAQRGINILYLYNVMYLLSQNI